MDKPQICIPGYLVDEITKHDLNVSSEERAVILRKYLNESDAHDFNVLFERSTLLKNQETAFNRFVDDIKGLNAEKKAKIKLNAQKELARKRQMMYNSDGTINPEFEALLGKTDEQWQTFVKRAMDSKYEIDIPDDKIAEITNLKRQLDEFKQGTEEWGVAKIKLADAIDSVKNPTNELGFVDTLKYGANQTKQEFKNTEGVLPKTGVLLKSIGNVLGSEAYRAVKASVDLSFALNQGYKILLDNPKNWAKSMGEALSSIKGLGKKDVMDMYHVKLASDVDFNAAVDNGLRIGGLEEYFKDTLFSKIPGLGRVIKTTDNAFTIFVQTARFNIFKQQYKALKEIAEITGEAIPENAIKDIAEVANSITGSGSFGKAESAVANLNKVFFAARYTKSAIDTLYQPIKMGFDGTASKVAKVRAAKLMAKYIGVLGGVGGTVAMIAPDRVVMDPSSPKFGKIRVGEDRWVNYGGPLPSYITTMWRVLAGVSTNADGKTSKLNTDEFGSKTRLDVLTNFAKNKLAPVPSIVMQAFLVGKDYKGEKFDPKNIPDSLLTPISAGSIFEMAQTDPSTLEAILIGAGEIFGASETNYRAKGTKSPIRAVIDGISGN